MLTLNFINRKKKQMFTFTFFSFIFLCVLVPSLSFSNESLSAYQSINMPAGARGKLIPVVKGEILLSFDKNSTELQKRMLFDEYGLVLKNFIFRRNLYQLSIPPRQKIISILKEKGLVPSGEKTGLLDIYNLLKTDKRIFCAAPNVLMKSSVFVPNDPLFSYQWNINSDNFLDMVEGWEIEQGDPGVIIAILDSGIAYENYNVYTKMDDFEGINFTSGFDFVNNDTHPNDDFNHGTHITGIICAALNNGKGICGLAPGCSIMPVKILNNKGMGTLMSLIQGLDYAVDHGADVINLSVSFPPEFDPPYFLSQAIADAYNSGVVLVAAAGNDGLSKVSYPAAFNECIAVGAIISKTNLKLANYSNFGDALDVVATGGDNKDREHNGYPDGILSLGFASQSPSIQVGYWFGYGTSQATAHVSALAGLLLSNGAANSDVVRNAILKTCTNIGSPGWDKHSGYGLVNPVAALQQYSSISIDPYDTFEGTIDGQYVTLAAFPNLTGLILQFPDGRSVCFINYGGCLYALVDYDSTRIACYELPGVSIYDILNFPGGPINYISNNGGIIAWLNDSGGFIAWINDSGGLIAWLDDSGGLIAWLNDSGNALGFIDNSGGLIAWINDSGGIIAWLNDSGGFIAWLDDSGGTFTYFAENYNWEFLGCMKLDGTLTDYLEGVSFDLISEL